MRAQPPELLRNVYRDMRDRRLLSIAFVLVVAIIAVPVLLSGGGADVSPSAVAPAASGALPAPVDGVAEIDPVVLTDVPGLRNFRKRLKGYQSRNPFEQQLTAPPGGSAGGTLTDQTGATGGSGSSSPSPTGAGTSSTEPGGSNPTGSAPGAPPAPPADPPPTPTPSPEPVPAPDPHPNPGNGGGNSGNGGGDHGDPGGNPANDGGARLITFRLDVRTGPVGDTRIERGVKSLTVLPDRRHPIAQYVESDVEGKSASFVISPSASVLPGDGRCDPDRKSCHFLLMKPGDDQTFLSSTDERKYRIELLAIHRHSEPVDNGGQAKPRVVLGYDPLTQRSTVTGR